MYPLTQFGITYPDRWTEHRVGHQCVGLPKLYLCPYDLANEQMDEVKSHEMRDPRKANHVVIP